VSGDAVSRNAMSCDAVSFGAVSGDAVSCDAARRHVLGAPPNGRRVVRPVRRPRATSSNRR
jgi:hypothetical protein